MDFRTHRQKKNGWWVEQRSTIPCILPADGQIAVFLLADAEEALDSIYFYQVIGDCKFWYFEDVGPDDFEHGRQIAEKDYEFVVCNPTVLWDLFLNDE